MSNLTENLRQWRQYRNITKADYLVFVGNILEELLEPLYDKSTIEDIKDEFMTNWINGDDSMPDTLDIIDAIQDIQVFCINETELMGFDNIKCNNEVFKHINCRKQDPIQKEQWAKFGTYGKWLKDTNQNSNDIYEPNYEDCRIGK